MSGAGYIYVRNWEKRQHHKYESPPWHKVYNNTLRDDDYLSLSAADRGVLHGLWSLASLSGDGRVSADQKFLARQLNVRRVNLKPLVDAGFVTIEKTKGRRISSESQTRSDAVEVQLSVSRESSQSHPSGISDPSEPRNDAASWQEFGTKRLRDESETVTTETEQRRVLKAEEPALHIVNGERPPGHAQWQANLIIREDSLGRLLTAIGSAADQHTEKTLQRIIDRNNVSQHELERTREATLKATTPNRSRYAVGTLKHLIEERSA